MWLAFSLPGNDEASNMPELTPAMGRMEAAWKTLYTFPLSETGYAAARSGGACQSLPPSVTKSQISGCSRSPRVSISSILAKAG